MNNKDKFLMFLSLICLPFGELAAEQTGTGLSSPINQEVLQNIVKITGQVIDLQGEPIIGATVMEKGTANGIVTDLDGNFSLQVPKGKTIAVSPVGCSVFAYNYIDVDWIQAAHGRACAVATAAKRLHPDSLVFTYQGDGDMSAIGTGETIHAAARGENIVAIYINNAIYGMTGGQMAPTTLLGMKTATTPYGRDPRLNGYPYKIAEMMAHLDGVTYITRQSVYNPAHVRQTKKAIRKAFENAMAGNGFSLVEVVSTCNSGWKMSPVAANKWLEENMLPFYQLGDIKDLTKK